MNLQSLSYFVIVAQEMNMTKAAHRLHMTQQALSFHIQKLEEYYGTPLFYRRPKFGLTYAGEVLLKNVPDILNRCDYLRDQMASISGVCAGRLRIGISPHPAKMILPSVVPPFLEKWPNVSLVFEKRSMVERTKAVLDGNLDFSIGIYNGKDPHLSVELLFNDPLYMITSRDLLFKCYGADYAEELIARESSGTDLQAFSALPFMLLSGTSHLGQVINEYLDSMKIKLNVVITTASLDTISPLVPLAVGATFCGRLRAAELRKVYPNLLIFPLRVDTGESTHQFKIISLKGRPAPIYAEDFISLVRAAFININRQLLV